MNGRKKKMTQKSNVEDAVIVRNMPEIPAEQWEIEAVLPQQTMFVNGYETPMMDASPGPLVYEKKSALPDVEWTEAPIEKFVSPCPPPTPYERELLDILIEECSEVIQRATKMKRFGVAETQPGQPHSNITRLSHEVGDIHEIVALCEAAGLINVHDVTVGRMNKRRQLAKYMQTEKPA